MFDTWLGLFMYSVACFRLTRLIVFDKITFFLRKPFHKEIEMVEEDGSISTYIELKGTGLRYWIGELLSCYWCTGIWCSLFLYAAWLYWPEGTKPIVIVLALAGIGGILESLVRKMID